MSLVWLAQLVAYGLLALIAVAAIAGAVAFSLGWWWVPIGAGLVGLAVVVLRRRRR